MKEILLEFYVNKYNYLKNSNEIDLSFIPPIMRRRMSIVDKYILSVLNNIYSDNIENIVFSSQYGEVERLIKLINQYTENKEVSPNAFSGSVHNYSEGFFLLNKQKSIPYTAVSSCEHSISMGFLSAVVSNYNNIIFCYVDVDTNSDNQSAFAINLTKTPESDTIKYTIKLKNNPITKDDFDNYIKLFSGNITTLKTPIYTIERAV